MGQLVYKKDEEISPQLLTDLMKIVNSKKITRVLDQPHDILLIYEENSFRGQNKDFNFIPNKIFIDSYKRVIYTDYIEFPIKFFKYLMPKIEKVLPNIFKFINDEKIESVKIKPCHLVTLTNSTKVAVGMKDVIDIQSVFLDPKNAPCMDIFVVCEIIRKFYAGEDDKIDGFLIRKSVLKFIKAITEEEINSEYILEKVFNNPSIVSVSDFVKGTEDKRYLSIFSNQIFRATKMDPYLENMDLKYLCAVDVIGNLLHEKRFGRR